MGRTSTNLSEVQASRLPRLVRSQCQLVQVQTFLVAVRSQPRFPLNGIPFGVSAVGAAVHAVTARAGPYGHPSTASTPH